jgi:hypothetical protein
MGRLPWYKAEPGAFFHATRGWRGELKCVYRTVLDLIYWHEGGLPDDDGYVAGQLGYPIRAWRRLRNELIGLGKLYVEDGHIRNRRADGEVVKALSKLEQTAKAGSRGGNSRVRVEKGNSGPESNDSNDKAQADAQADFKQILDLDSESENKTQKHAAVRPESHDSHAREAPPGGLPTAADGATLRAAVWQTGVRLLGPNSRPLIGRWVKDYGFGSTAQALADCEREVPADPRGWITAALQYQAGTRSNDRSPMAVYERVKRRMNGGDPYADHDVSHLLALMPSGTVQ